MLSDISDIILSGNPWTVFTIRASFSCTFRVHLELCERENFIFTLTNFIPRDCGRRKKKEGANRRVELDKLARLQIRDWNLHGGLCKSLEKEVIKRNRRWRNFVIISILYYQNIIRMEYQSGMKLFIYDNCYFSDFACYYYFISFRSIFINIFRFPNETKRYLFESPYKRKYKTNRKICGKKRVELNPSGWGTN